MIARMRMQIDRIRVSIRLLGETALVTGRTHTADGEDDMADSDTGFGEKRSSRWPDEYTGRLRPIRWTPNWIKRSGWHCDRARRPTHDECTSPEVCRERAGIV